MSKIVVTGGAGFIGSNLCNFLITEGHEVIAFDNLMLGKKENLNENVQFIQGDVENMQDLETCGTDIDYIVHLAAASSAPMFQEDIVGSYSNNVIGYMNVLEFARKNNISKVLYASTSSIYGNNPTPLTEDQNVVPVNYYSVTKYAMEQTSHVYAAQHGMDLIGFRFMSVYGLNEKHKGNFANLVSQFIWDIENDRSPILYGDGKQQRDFTNVKDIVQAIYLAMQSDKKFGSTIFNIGTSEAYNLLEVVEFINEIMGKNIAPEHIENPVKEGYIRSQQASIDKIQNELGYKPTVNLKDGMKEIIENL